ncbi:MAG: hypothetical protein KUG78_13940 [Kangiellaceae bacterium]|nr:hypothetical protein [Kangiellaceae bacterium]
MNIVSTPQALIPIGTSRNQSHTPVASSLVQKSGPLEGSSPSIPLKPRQIERIATNSQQESSKSKRLSSPLGQYQDVESLRNRQELESLVGVDIYV